MEMTQKNAPILSPWFVYLSIVVFFIEDEMAFGTPNINIGNSTIMNRACLYYTSTFVVGASFLARKLGLGLCFFFVIDCYT